MPLDTLPGKLITLSRDQRVSRFLRDVQFRNPGASTLPGTQPYIDAQVIADATDVHTSNAVTISNGVTRGTATGQAVDDWCARLGTKRLPPSGGAGAVAVTTSSGGSTIEQGDICYQESTGLQFQCLATALYTSATPVPISGVSTGFQTNLPAGTVLKWQAPRPGCASTCTVTTQADGSGLSGGAPVESDDDCKRRLDYIAANPAASGNDAEYQATIATTQALSVQQAFTWPCIIGPGSKGASATLRPSQPGGNRIPSPAALSLIAQNIAGQLPADDGIYQISLIASPVVIVLKAIWAVGASAWADSSTWPTYYPSPNLVVAGTPAAGGITSTSFRLSSASLTAATGPSVGQSIGFLDLTNGVFRRKKILTVTAISATQFDVTVDTSNGISDTSYAPAVGQACCPWSDSLTSLVSPVVTYFDTLGPGEMVASFADPGLRQRRSPASPQFWPSVITNRLLGGAAAPIAATGAAQNLPPVPTLFTTSTIQDVVLVEPTVPSSTPIGAPGSFAYLLTLSNLLAFPE